MIYKNRIEASGIGLYEVHNLISKQVKWKKNTSSATSQLSVSFYLNKFYILIFFNNPIGGEVLSGFVFHIFPVGEY